MDHEDQELDTSTVGEVFEDKPEVQPNEDVTETNEGVTDTVETTETSEETTTTEAAPPAAEMVPTAALLDERRKRQEAEDKLNEVLASHEPVPDQYEDPEGHAAYIQRQQATGKINGSRDTVMEIKEDYSEMESVFLGMVTDDRGNVTNQSLINQMNAAKSPALFAYNKAKEHKELERYSDPAARAKYETDLKEKLLNEIRAELGQKPLETVPNLTGATATAKNGPEIIPGAETVDELFPDP